MSWDCRKGSDDVHNHGDVIGVKVSVYGLYPGRGPQLGVCLVR